MKQIKNFSLVCVMLLATSPANVIGMEATGKAPENASKKIYASNCE